MLRSPRRLLLALVPLLLVGTASARAADTVPGQVVVGFSSSADANTRANAREAVDGRLRRRLIDSRTQVVSVDGSVATAVRELRSRRGVRFAEPNYVGHVADTTPDDASFELQWNMNKIAAPAAWDVTKGSPAVKLAVLDTGIDLDHPDLVGQIDAADGYDVVDGDTTPDDPADASFAVGHGTHVAGIAGALGDNGVGVAGVGWQSSLVPFRVCGKDGGCTATAVADGINLARKAGAKVVNISIDGLGDSTAVRDAITNSPNLLIVVAAGNLSRNVDTIPDYPCSYGSANLICVASSINNAPDTLSASSNYGATSVDLAAPGDSIYSTLIGGVYGYKSGTSMASPHVAGAAALLWADAPTATVAQVRAAILNNGDAKPYTGKVASGRRLNVSKALIALPGVQITSGPAAGSPSRFSAFEFRATPAGTSFQCRVDSGTYAACTSPYAPANLADGDHTVSVRAVTGGIIASRQWTLDTTAPDLDLVGTPASTEQKRSASVSFTTAGGATSVRCSLDGAPSQLCSSPYRVTGLADGSHEVEIVAADAAGNTTPATASWTVDAAPLTTITAGPAGPTRSTVASFSFNAAGADGFNCALDSGAFEPCSSPYSLPGLTQGPHTLKVAATDGVHPDNVEYSTRTWTVDTVAPVVSVTSAPDGLIASRNATIGFSVGESAVTQCSIDGSAFTACGSPLSLVGLADGTHLAVIRATDAAGNVGTTGRSWSVDATAPGVVIEDGTAGEGAASFSFRADDGAFTSCAVDNGPFVACSSPATYSGVADGQHTFRVRASDALGNTAETARGFSSFHAPVATATPTPTPGPALAKPTAVAKAIAAKLAKRSPASLAKAKTFTVKYAAPAAGKLRITVRLRGGKTLLTAVATASKKRTVSVRVKRSKAAAKALRKLRTAKLEIVARFAPEDGGAVSATRRLTLKTR